MELRSTPDELACTECGDEIADAGYLLAAERDGAYAPTEVALCNACGFNEVGFAGCAPEPADVADAGPDDVLLQIRVEDGDVEVLGAKG